VRGLPTSTATLPLRLLACACVTWVSIAWTVTARAADNSARPAHGLIVQLKDAPPHDTALATLEDERLRRVLGAAGVAAAHSRPLGRAAHRLDFGRVLGSDEAAALAAQLRSHPEVEWVVANERERRLVTPSDTLFPATPTTTGQWWLFGVSGSNANALTDRLRGVPGFQSAWGTTTGNAAAIVAVLDTGITAHPDLDAHVLPGYDFVSTVEFANDGNGRDADPSDPGDWVTQADKNNNPTLFGSCDVANSSWHGTDIAGIVAAVTDNAFGVAGINWNGRVLPVRVAGKCGAEVADIVDGMYWAAGLPVSGVPINPNPARVVNISFGGDAACNAAYQTAINDLAAQGVVVVAAAGNEHGSVARPANCSGVVAVAALNRDGFKATYSNFGAQITLATVGGDYRGDGAWGSLLGDDGLLILDNGGTTSPGSPTYSRVFGSSFSAPIVAGAVSLMLSANPNLSVTQIVSGLRISARPHVTSPKIGACSAQNPGRCICSTATCGAGILDATQAVLYALNPSSYVAPAQSPAVIDNADVDAAVALGNDLPPNATTSGGGSTGGGGGGALDLSWLLALAIAVRFVAREGGR